VARNLLLALDKPLPRTLPLYRPGSMLSGKPNSNEAVSRKTHDHDVRSQTLSLSQQDLDVRALCLRDSYNKREAKVARPPPASRRGA
jgi:hypothetical protein